MAAAINTITVDDLRRHVLALSDDTLEGREAGSRGGRVAAGYLGREFAKSKLAGGAADGGYYQSFGAQYRNILGLLEGSDPVLKQQVVLVSAHYDHVGYGNAQNSYGPIGFIHNGADDNASGVSGLLETIEAFATLNARPKRSILFVLWDGEEKGLLGSKHWVANPTKPLSQVPMMVNMDMIGRMRNHRVEVYGARSAPGLRRLVSLQNGDSDLRLDFLWEVRDDSDHHSFHSRGIPVLMLHTGLHEDYHRPSDDTEKLDVDGMHRVIKLLFNMVLELANYEGEIGQPPFKFREASRRESAAMRRAAETPLPPLPGRLGLSWDAADDQAGPRRVTRVAPGSAAARAGLRPGDTMTHFAGQELTAEVDLRALVLAAENPVTVTIKRGGAGEPLDLSLQLAGPPVRLGLAWREDNAEPATVAISRVVPASPAAKAGLLVNDRVYEVGGVGFQGGEEFKRLLTQTTEPVELMIERQGRVQRLLLAPASAPAALQPIAEPIDEPQR